MDDFAFGLRGGRPYLKIPDHPLADRKGWVPEHRVVALEAWGAAPRCCHWCATVLRWGGVPDEDQLCIDHLDGDRANNVIANLAPSCRRCNLHRGKSAWLCVHRALTTLGDTDPTDTPRLQEVTEALERSRLLHEHQRATQPTPRPRSAVKTIRVR